MKETVLSNKLMELFRCIGHAARIENAISSGMPDISVCVSGHEFWVETKIGEPKLRPYQLTWILRARVNGRRIFVITFDEDYVVMPIRVWDCNDIKTEFRGKHHVIVSEPRITAESISETLINTIVSIV